MSGHNKWSSIKHRKGAQDKKRAKVFNKLIKELTVSARMGGGDPDGNPRLRSALLAARAANMPKDNIDRAVKKGTGELEGTSYDEAVYEGYGPEGVALLVEAMTDNLNRTISEVRAAFNKGGGKLGEPGSVAWMFEQKGRIVVLKEHCDFDTLFEQAAEAGADDVEDADDAWHVVTSREDLYSVAGQLEEAGISYEEASLAQFPQTTIEIATPESARKIMRLVDMIEDGDDVQTVWGNFDLSDEAAAALEED